jgi:hypothetical protein
MMEMMSGYKTMFENPPTIAVLFSTYKTPAWLKYIILYSIVADLILIGSQIYSNGLMSSVAARQPQGTVSVHKISRLKKKATEQLLLFCLLLGYY